MINKGQSDGRLFVSFSFKKVEIYFTKQRFFRKNALSGLKNDISGQLSQSILSACYTDIIKLKEIMKMSIAKKSEDTYFSWFNLLLVLLLVFILGQILALKFDWSDPLNPKERIIQQDKEHKKTSFNPHRPFELSLFED